MQRPRTYRTKKIVVNNEERVEVAVSTIGETPSEADRHDRKGRIKGKQHYTCSVLQQTRFGQHLTVMHSASTDLLSP